MTTTEVRVDALTVGPFQENCYFVGRKDRPETIIVDPGDEAPRLIAFIEDHRWRPLAIVNTHAHLDHIGAVAALKDRYHIPFRLHPEEFVNLQQAPDAARLFGVNVPVVPEVDLPLAHGEQLELAGVALAVRHTPGHAPGHVCLVLEGMVFAGDALFYGSIGRTDLPGGDTQTLLNSIAEELLSLPDSTVVYCGHGPSTTIGRERLRNPFLAGLGTTGA